MYRVLIVEDEHLIRKGLVYGFNYQEAGCVVVGEAANGQVGAKKIKELNPDIVVTDINMPIMNAFQMLEETLDYSFSTIIVSGYDEFSNAKKAIKYGVSEFIVKPIDMQQFAAALERAKQQCQMNHYFMEEQKKSGALAQVNLIEKEFTAIENVLIRQMITFVEKNYAKRFVFQDVADEVGYSATLLHNQFKKYMNTTFNDYVNRYRIQKALEHLRNQDLKLYEIAEACGFSDYKYFNKVFKKYVSVSPKEFLERVGV